MFDEQAAIVIDNGSFECKAGFSAEDEPKCFFRAIVGRPKSMSSYAFDDGVYVGDMAFCKKGHLKLTYPFQDGMIENWDDKEQFWHHAIYNELRLCPEEKRPLFISKAAMSYKSSSEKKTCIFFENFDVPKFFMGDQSVMSIIASGRTTGIVVNSGNDITSTVAIYEGHALQQTIQQSPVAGRACTDWLIRILGELGINFTTTAERKVTGDIKEKITYIALDYLAELAEYRRSSINYKPFELPDGNFFVIEDQRFRCPEILFQPTICGTKVPGVHELTLESIMQSDLDLREILFENIVLSGGTTLIPGFRERLSREITSVVQHRYKIKVIAPPERKFSAWIGSSILSSFSFFEPMWITRAGIL